jgi:hypothetical protein
LTVAKAISDHLADHAARHMVHNDQDAIRSARASDAVNRLAGQIRSDGIRRAAPLIADGALGNGCINITLDAAAFARATGLPEDDLNPKLLKIDRPFTCRRRGVEMKIVAVTRAPAPDAAMIRALRNAHRWADALKSGAPLTRLATDEKTSERYAARIITLSGLSPRIQAAILDGTQPADLTLKRLLATSLPLDWHDQQQALGFRT